MERQALVAARRAMAAGEPVEAARTLRQALALAPNLPHVHLQLARMRFPGPDYLHWLAWLHQRLSPRLYLEIGVETGHSLRLALPPTVAIGIDPALLAGPLEGLQVPARLYRMTSTDFWRNVPPDSGLQDHGFDLAFVDGDHQFGAVLRDFTALEACAAPGALIAVHDTVPLDALTASPMRTSGFYSGDGWKLVMCLRALRPDLAMVTLPVGPTGLTLIGRLDPASTMLVSRMDAIEAAYAQCPADQALRRLGDLVDLSCTTPEQLSEWIDAVLGPDAGAVASHVTIREEHP